MLHIWHDSLQVMKTAAETLIPVTLELGGKDAFIVCEDVDLDHVCILFNFTLYKYFYQVGRISCR